MTNNITRRDFLNGTQIAVGAALTAPLLRACGVQSDTFTPYEFALPADYYPPAKMGMRGSHDGSWEAMHGLVSGEPYGAASPDENYDLVVVGGGISGLAAAHFYRKDKPNAKILILDNHDDFGGHAKRNEFDINGEIRMSFGGTEAIDTPSHYTPEAIGLLEDIGIKLEKFYDYYDQGFFADMGLSKGIVFDAEYFSEEKLVTGYGKKSWEEFAAETPMSDKARADLIRVQTAEVDYMPGKTFEEKYAILRKTGYETFLRDYCKVDEEVINIYKRWGMSFWCVGIDEVPTTAIQDYDGGMPGVEHTLKRTGYRNDEPYIFHFPDGNASVARLIVRHLIPEAVPGSTQEDVVTAKVDYSKLDMPGRNINIRLNSTAMHVANTADKSGVNVTYMRGQTTHAVFAKKVVMACYNSAIPYLCPEMSAAQKKALAYNIKVPLVYTKVMLPNWRPFAELGMDFVYYTGGFYKQAELAYPVSIGDYQMSNTPDDPMVVHMCHVPWVPNVQGPRQWRDGRLRILRTRFEKFEANVHKQLNQALGSTGFESERDVSAITVNRWPHGYAYSPDLTWEPDYADEASKPWVKGRQAFGNIHIANSDAGAKADTDAAITQAYRAVSEILG